MPTIILTTLAIIGYRIYKNKTITYLSSFLTGIIGVMFIMDAYTWIDMIFTLSPDNIQYIYAIGLYLVILSILGFSLYLSFRLNRKNNQQLSIKTIKDKKPLLIMLSTVFLVFGIFVCDNMLKMAILNAWNNKHEAPAMSYGNLNGLSYNTVVSETSTSTYMGKGVKWLGVIAGMSQIDGIKFWVADKDHTSFNNSYHDWFWAIPNDPNLLLGPEQTHGEWVTYMLKTYGNIDADTTDPTHDLFLITGKLDENDCTFYDSTPTTTAPCIPNVIVEKIERAGKVLDK